MLYYTGQTDNFDIDSTSGWITVKSTLDRDAPDVRQSGGVYALYVKVRVFQCSLHKMTARATTKNFFK